MAILKKKIKDGVRYMVRVRDPNQKWYPAKVFPTLSEAKEYERYLENLSVGGGISNSREARSLTMDDYWEYWSKNCRLRTGEGWKMSQDQMWRLHLQPLVGSLVLVEVKPHHLTQLFTTLERNGVKQQMRYHMYNMLHKMFADALEDLEMISTNPVKRKFKPVVPKKEARFLEPMDARKLLDCSRDHYVGAAIWMCILSGLRAEAVLALKVGSVNFKTKQILICEAWKSKIRKTLPYPKGKRHEYVPMPDLLLQHLAPLVQNKSPDDFVVTNKDGTKMLSYRAFNECLKKLCKKAEVQVITPHGLRHTTSELYVEQGASREDVRRLLNHKSHVTTLTYMHRTDERLLRIASNVGALGDENLSRLASVVRE